MPIDEELCELLWPDEFTVEYADGSRELLLRGEGVHITPPADDPETIGNFCADLPKKHPRQCSQYGREVSFNELRAIYAVDGRLLWTKA